MKVQRIRLPSNNQIAWVVLGDDYLPIKPIQQYLEYLRGIERSPNTVRSYAFHLRLYWEFLITSGLEWTSIKLDNLADFIIWLRSPDPNVLHIQQVEAKRTEGSVNAILSSVCMFYDFHEKTGTSPEIPLYGLSMQPTRRYKSFLHHIAKGKPVRTRLIKLKVPKHFPKTISNDQVKAFINACNRIRDKFLICLLHETGMRIGQALGLRHEDILSWDNQIQIVPRDNNVNGARSKSKQRYVIDTSKDLMSLYTQYLINEFDEVESDFVFVNLWEGEIGSPMRYGAIADLFHRLSKLTGINVNPHMLRHTHATDLIQNGMDMAYVQKRLGHASVQTTIDTYVHLTNDDMKKAYKNYLQEKDK